MEPSDPVASTGDSNWPCDPAGALARHVRLKKLLSHLESHPSEHLTTAAAARIACFQENYFCGWFKRNTGHTFSSWQRAWRVTRIARILLTEHVSIARAAERYGYLNMRTFERAFKAHFQITAREFRRQQQERYQAPLKVQAEHEAAPTPTHPPQHESGDDPDLDCSIDTPVNCEVQPFCGLRAPVEVAQPTFNILSRRVYLLPRRHR